MPISGLVLVLDERAGDAHATLETLRADSKVTVGRVAGNRVPIVLETTSDTESRERLRWLEAQPGVAMVQVAYVDHSDVNAGKEGAPHGG